MLHLFHPALVHLSVAFVVTGALVEAWGLWTGRATPARWGSSLLIVGLITLVPTIASGYVAANTVRVPPGGTALLDAHERNGWILLFLALGSQFWKAWCGGRVPERQQPAYAALLVTVAALTAYSAWLGGQMVYVQGIGVR